MLLHSLSNHYERNCKMAQVTLKDVRKVYPNGFEAVKTISLDITDGEFVVLVGPSGCGKSTTLRMVAGLEDVDSGTITIGDKIVNDVHPKDRDIAMVFQNYALYPHMTVFENMAFALKLRKVPREQVTSRVNQAAATLGIETLLTRKPGQLSGGQRQRVAVGRAIVREPKAFLFDEPLSNLDAKLRVSTRAELKALHQRLKTTTIYVTHDQEEAMTLGDRIVVMSNGIIQQVGPPLDVYQSPVNRFVAAFIGMPPMNFIDGTIVREGEQHFFVESGGACRLKVPASKAAKLAACVNTPIVLGIRPQIFSEVPAAVSGGTIETHVNLMEPLGDSMDVYFSSGKHTNLVARLAARTGVQSNMPIHLAVNMERAHFFELGEFGVRIA